MKVYVSADLEGVGGVCHRREVTDADRSAPDFQRAQRLMTAEVNAAVSAAFDAGAGEVVVNDAHAGMRNLLPDQLDPRARLIRGPVKRRTMTAGLDDTFDAAVLVGYHARAAADGVLSHTLNGAQLAGLWREGEPIGEIGLSALAAAEVGVPVVFLSGDQHACDEARQLLGDAVELFPTKRAVDRMTAELVSPERCVTGIGDAVTRALKSRPALLPLPTVHRFHCEWRSVSAAEVASWVPGVRRTSPTGCEFTAGSVGDAVDLLVVLLLAATGLEGLS